MRRSGPGALPRRVARSAGTIRFRITGLATLAVFLVLVATGFGLVSAQRHVLTETVDEGVEGNVDRIEDLVADGEPPPMLTALGEDDTVAQVVAVDDGEVISSSANVEGEPPIAAVPASVSGDDDDDQIRTVHGIPVDDDEGFRLLSRMVDRPDGPVVIHVAATLDDIDESVAILNTSLLVAIPAVVVLLALLVWWLVGRTLGPVEAIRAEVANIGGTDLHRRVPVPPHDDEIGRLARTMNDMLGRVDQAVQRQQQFVADASHELRSPLTRMRAAAEVDVAHPEVADTAATRRSVLEETVGLQHLVEDLLHLARSDARPIGPGKVRPVDLDDLVLRLTRRLEADDRISVDVGGVTAAQVPGQADQLVRAVGNLLDNAVRHAATTVAVALHEEGGEAVLSVGDDGPGIPVELHEWVFERFTRLDDARSTTTGGAGLGLAITRDIVHRHGGTIAIDPRHRPGARFVVRLPLESEAGSTEPTSSGPGGAAPPHGVVDEQDDHRTDDRPDQPAGAEDVVAVEDQPPDEAAEVRADDADGHGRPEGHRVLAGDQEPGQVAGDHADNEQADEETDHRATSTGDVTGHDVT